MSAENSIAGMRQKVELQCLVAADKAVPEYRHGSRSYSCSGHVAKRWQAAWDGACWALGTDPAAFWDQPARSPIEDQKEGNAG